MLSQVSSNFRVKALSINSGVSRYPEFDSARMFAVKIHEKRFIFFPAECFIELFTQAWYHGIRLMPVSYRLIGN